MSAAPIVAADAPAAAQACARHVIALLEDALSRRDVVTLAVSGGSTPKLLFDQLAAGALRWDRVHVFWVDERCVPPTDDASNYKLAYQRLIEPAHIPEANVHRIYGEMDPPQAAARYVADIRGFFRLHGAELPRFDVVHRGMGPDAHTASLFPGAPLIQDHTGIAAAVFAPQFNQWRVTLLPGVLEAARNTVLLVAGADKAEALRAVFHDPYDPKKHPAQIGAREAVWFMDRAAACYTQIC
jgi:6-phosphogluconolactonase